MSSDEQKPFTPFVRRVGEHLSAYGEPCFCTTENNKAVPKVMPVAAAKKVAGRLRGSSLLNNFGFLEQERAAAQKWEKEKSHGR